MDAQKLHDLICRGMGNAARAIGDDYDLFRPNGPDDPLARGNRIMRLPVILDDLASEYRRMRNAEQGIRAIFDSISTQAGDYLQGPRGTLFVGVVPDRERPVCVLTNTSVDVMRAAGPGLAGLNGYGGVTNETLGYVLRGWPVRSAMGAPNGRGALPADTGQSGLTVLFPQTPAPIKAADVLQDEQGRRFVVLTADSTAMGWRLLARGLEV